jgi:MFS family permease
MMAKSTVRSMQADSPQSEDAPPGTAPYPSPRRAGFALGLLVLVVLIAYYDSQILALLMTPIQAAFHLSDTQMGILQGVALNMCFGLAALPLGLLIDRGTRIRIICVALVSWTSFTVLTGLCDDFWQLFACRMGVGLSEAGLAPAAYSLIADLYAPRDRATATSVFYGASLLGISASLALGGATIGWIANNVQYFPLGFSAMPYWRLSFVAATLPAVVLAILLLMVAEPARHSEVDPRIDGGKEVSLSKFLGENWVTLTCLLGGLVTVSVGVDALLTWMPTILVRAYGLSPANSGKWLGLAVGIGSVGGIGLAAVLNRVFQKRRGALACLQGLRIGAPVSALALAGLLVVPSVDGVLVLVALHTLFAFVAIGGGQVLVMNVAPNHLRGRIFAIYSFVSVVIGALPPTLIGVLSDRVFRGNQGLLLALCTVGVPCGAVASATFAVIVKPLRRTMGIPALALALSVPGAG